MMYNWDVPSPELKDFMQATPIVERLRFRRAPLAAAALWFAAGIVVQHQNNAHYISAPTPLLLACLALLVTLTVAALRWAERVAWVAAGGVWVALGIAAALWQPGPATPVKLLSYADNLSRTVRGRVIRVRVLPEHQASSQDADTAPPWESTEEAAAGEGRVLSVDLALDAVEELTPDTSSMIASDGGIRLSIYGADATGLALRCGDELEAPLRLKLPQRYRDPGAFQYSDYLLTQGVAALSSADADKVHVVGSAPATLRCRLAAAQAWASARLGAFVASPPNRRLPHALQLSTSDARMLDAMLFGDRTGLNTRLRVGFERTGTFHLFVVSGLHIALVAAALMWLMRRLRLQEWHAVLLTLGIATAYAALTGFGQPAQRALVMTSVYLLTRLLARDRDIVNALGAAALALLVWSPSSLFDPSFQMTALVIVAIGGIAVPLGQRTVLRFARATHDVFRQWRRDTGAREAQFVVMLELWGEACAHLLGPWALRLPAKLARWTLWAGELVLVSVVAELVMVLPMAMYFHRATVLGVPANVVVLPLVGLLAGAGVLTFLCSLLSPWLALVPSAATAALLHGVAWVIGYLSRSAAADLRIPGPSWWIAALALAGWAACCWAVRRSRWTAALAALALPLIAALILWPEPMIRTPGALEVTAIDVGQGDSLLLTDPTGRTILVDAGGPVGRNGPAEVVASFDVGEQVVAPYLWSRRVRRLDVMVLTHAHTDHMGGMPALLADLRPRELWVGIDPQSALYQALLAKALQLGVIVRHLHAGDRRAWGATQVSVLSPPAAYANPDAPRNDDSLVLRIDFGKASVLLEGDAERPSEDAMVAAGLIQPVTLLKVAHHGSRTSTSEQFLAAAEPRDAVVSVGRRNTFGHPRREVIDRLAAEGARVYRTDQLGLTTFLLDSGGGIRVLNGEASLQQR